MTNRILLIRTGGTIEAKSYDDPKNPPQNIITIKGENSPIFPAIKALPDHKKLDIHSWNKNEEKRFVKDSKFFSAQEIKQLAEIIENNNQHQHFMLTHGTDAITDNATLLGKELSGSNKTVLFVSSIVPLSMRKTHKCTSIKTLRYAMKNMFECSPGTYVVGTDFKNGQWGLFDPTTVYKDKETSLKRAALTLVAR